MTTYGAVCSNKNCDDIKLSTIHRGHTCANNHTGLTGKMECESAVSFYQCRWRMCLWYRCKGGEIRVHWACPKMNGQGVDVWCGLA